MTLSNHRAPPRPPPLDTLTAPQPGVPPWARTSRLAPSQTLAIPPEHDFRLSLAEWELAVFDRADRFVVSWFRGRDNRGRADHGDQFDEAVAACLGDERACLYAVAPTGRAVCLERADFPALLARWGRAMDCGRW